MTRFLFFLDLCKDEYTFGRGEACDYQFNSPEMVKNPCFGAYSKVHFKISRVRMEFTFMKFL